MRARSRTQRHDATGNSSGILLLWVLGFLTSVARPTQAIDINWGPFRMDVGFNVGTVVEYDDNVSKSETDPQEELDVRLTLGPRIAGGIKLPFTLRGGQELVLDMSFAYTYQISLVDAAKGNFGAPISATLNLPIALGQWNIVVADSFTFTNEPLESTFATDRARVNTYNNRASIDATRQMGRFALTLAAQRLDQITPDFPEQEETRYEFSVTPAYFLRANYSVFLRNSFSVTERASPAERDVVGYSTELGLSGQITQNITGSITLGYAISRLEALDPSIESGGIFDPIFADDDSGPKTIGGVKSTIALAYANPLRPNTTHSISVFRTPGVTAALSDSNIQETLGVNYAIAHRLTKDITLAPVVSWINLKDIGPEGSGEKTDIVAVNLGLSRRFGRGLSGALNYLYQSRMSSLPGRSYDVNRVTMSMNYTF